MTTTASVKPVKGLVFEHATKKKRYFYGPAEERPALLLTVTAVQKGVVHCETADYDRVRIPLASFEEAVGVVVSEPGPALKMSDAQCQALHMKAYAAGLAACDGAVVEPMYVAQHANPFDDNSPVIQAWKVDSGTCGFAWVVLPGDGAMGRWGRRKGVYGHNYGGGVMLWVRHGGQSIDRKEAFASAYAAVLKEAGIPKVYVSSRMD